MIRILSVTIISVAVLSGCASRGTSQTTGPAQPRPASAAPSTNVVHFGFDSSELNGSGEALVRDWASYLAGNPAKSVRVEGHTDSIGSDEYNQYLGEQRARAVKSGLVSGGANGSQVEVVSHGEERPAGNSNAQNRRVEIVE